MRLDKKGVVLVPKEYQDCTVELIGDTSDTGGIYVFIFLPNSTKITLWDTTDKGIEEQLIKNEIVILWEDDRTLLAFLSESNLNKRLAKKIINNLYQQNQPEMVLNLVQLEFVFNLSLITMTYYLVDNQNSTKNISFGQMESLLLDYLRT